jgi:hypothetical protein
VAALPRGTTRFVGQVVDEVLDLGGGDGT